MRITKLIRSPVLQRSGTRWLWLLNLGLLIALATYLGLTVRPSASAVATRYSTLQDLVGLGRWYSHYLPLLFLLIALVTNTIIANVLLKAEGSVELPRFAIKVMFFQLILGALTFVISIQLIEAV